VHRDKVPAEYDGVVGERHLRGARTRRAGHAFDGGIVGSSGGFASAHSRAARSTRTSAASASWRAVRAADSAHRASTVDAGAAVVVMSRTYVRPPTSGRADDRSVDNATMVDRGEWAVDAHPRGRRAELTYEPGAKANPALLRHARGAGRPPWVRSVGTAR